MFFENNILEALIEATDDLIFYKDMDFIYRGCNFSFEKFVGKSRDLIIDKDDFSIFSVEYAELFRANDIKVLREGKIYQNYEWVKYPNGTSHYLLTKKSPLKDANGRVIGLVGISRDMTEEYNLQENFRNLHQNLNQIIDERLKVMQTQERSLMQQSKMIAMKELIVSIAHNWRQPLNVISLLIQDLEDAYDFGELNEEYLREMIVKSQKQIEFMSNTIHNFQNFFQTNSLKYKFDIKESILNVINLLSEELNSLNIAINLDLISCDIYAQRDGFEQVIFHLISNTKDAIRAKKEHDGGIINIKTEIINRDIKISISDNGIGIKDGIVDRILPYFTTKEQGEGVGIGLYMSKIIVEKWLDGELYLNKDYKNGAEFIIELRKRYD